jgi:hypothetical protein
MDFSSLNLSDIQSSEQPTESMSTEPSPKMPEVAPEIKKTLDGLDPMDIINYLKQTEILPLEFEMSMEMEPQDEMAPEAEGEFNFGDLSIDEVDTPVNVAGGA